MSSQHDQQTQAIHAGRPETLPEGAVVTPIYQSATFEYAGAENYHDLRYIRLNNTPNHNVLHARLAALAGAEAALVTGSGMAAITTAIIATLRSGDHLIAQDCLYGGTRAFLETDAVDLGIETTFVDGSDPASWEAARKSSTRAIYVESISNPLLQVPELSAVPRFAHKHGLASLIDNTFASPVNFQPLALGFDLELHSATKYLNGHSDIVAGAVMGGAEAVGRVAHKLDHFGGSLDPHACFLLERGMKTLSLRVRQQNRNAQALAQWLAARPEVLRVAYPGLPTDPGYARAQQFFRGSGGVLSFELAGTAATADAFMRRLELATIAPSLGGVETLVTRPSTTSHRGMTPEARAHAGISDSLVRLAVGIEATEDLIRDVQQALG